MSEIALIKKSELLKVEEAPFNTDQINLFLRKTPARFKKTRPAKGGGTWTYVSGAYVKKMLHLAFGWDWDFEIVDEMENKEKRFFWARLTPQERQQVTDLLETREQQE